MLPHNQLSVIFISFTDLLLRFSDFLSAFFLGGANDFFVLFFRFIFRFLCGYDGFHI